MWVALKNGDVIRVSVGNGEGDPKFTIDDLLPHLGVEQSKKALSEAIPAESLNILVGSRPLADDEGSDRVKIAILELLNRKYGIVEEDFISAELSAVPPSTPVISVLTALSSGPTATTTGCAPTPPWRPSSS